MAEGRGRRGGVTEAPRRSAEGASKAPVTRERLLEKHDAIRTIYAVLTAWVRRVHSPILHNSSYNHDCVFCTQSLFRIVYAIIISFCPYNHDLALPLHTLLRRPRVVYILFILLFAGDVEIVRTIMQSWGIDATDICGHASIVCSGNGIVISMSFSCNLSELFCLAARKSNRNLGHPIR